MAVFLEKNQLIKQVNYRNNFHIRNIQLFKVKIRNYMNKKWMNKKRKRMKKIKNTIIIIVIQKLLPKTLNIIIIIVIINIKTAMMMLMWKICKNKRYWRRRDCNFYRDMNRENRLNKILESSQFLKWLMICIFKWKIYNSNFLD